METTLNNKFFDFEKAKVQTLSLDQLARTHKENDIYGKPLRGIYHYDLLNQIIGMCNAQNYDVEVYDLFAAQNKEVITQHAQRPGSHPGIWAGGKVDCPSDGSPGGQGDGVRAGV